MGYDAHGYIEVISTTEIQTALALDIDRLWERTGTYGDTDGYLRRTFEDNSSDDLIDRLLVAAGFEVHTISGPNEDGHYEHGGDYEGRWWSAVEEVLGFLASHGCGVTGSMTGEDGEAWAYNAFLNGHALGEDTLSSVPDKELERLKSASDRLDEIADLVNDSTLDDTTLAARVRALFI